MMKRYRWQVIIGISLLTLSFLLYILHYAVFRDTHHIFIYLLGDLAFLPIEVLLVVLIVDGMLSARERRETMEKMNMVIGAFFSEMGTSLLQCLHDYGFCPPEIEKDLLVSYEWSEKNFQSAKREVMECTYRLDASLSDLEELKAFLLSKREIMLRLLENPNLLEHETFTDLLWALSHLSEELSYREDLKNLKESDLKHLENDIRRVYTLLIYEWMEYLKHLKNNYPYLFSLEVRVNPFNPTAEVEVS